MSAQACEHCGQPIIGHHVCPNDASNSLIWVNQDAPLSATQLHGLYQEDLLEGIRCGQCAETAAMSKQDYRTVVTAAHGIEPKP